MFKEAILELFGRKFGDGKFLGDKGRIFDYLPIDMKIRLMGWSHACPVIDEVVREYAKSYKDLHPEVSNKEAIKQGKIMTLSRYSECNFMYGYCEDLVKPINSILASRLAAETTRRTGEEPGKVSNKFIPKDYKSKVSKMSHIVGYALPRIAIEERGRGTDNITWERFEKMSGVIEDVARKCDDPIEYMVQVAEQFTKMEVHPDAIMDHMLAKGILLEQGCKGDFKEVFEAIDKFAPNIKARYDELGVEGRKKFGLVERSEL